MLQMANGCSPPAFCHWPSNKWNNQPKESAVASIYNYMFRLVHPEGPHHLEGRRPETSRASGE